MTSDDRCRNLMNQIRWACMLQDTRNVQYNSNQTNKKSLAFTNYSLQLMIFKTSKYILALLSSIKCFIIYI